MILLFSSRHYLDPLSLAAFIEADESKAESYCLGKIVGKRVHTVAEEESESYGIPEGEALWICSAEPIGLGE